jgi:hypothetical protein
MISMEKKNWLPLGLGLVGGLLAFGASRGLESLTASGWQPIAPPTRLVADVPGIAGSTDFSAAAESAVNSVVHVKTSVEQGYYFNPFRDFFFGFGEQSPQPCGPRSPNWASVTGPNAPTCGGAHQNCPKKYRSHP